MHRHEQNTGWKYYRLWGQAMLSVKSTREPFIKGLVKGLGVTAAPQWKWANSWCLVAWLKKQQPSKLNNFLTAHYLFFQHLSHTSSLFQGFVLFRIGLICFCPVVFFKHLDELDFRLLLVDFSSFSSSSWKSNIYEPLHSCNKGRQHFIACIYIQAWGCFWEALQSQINHAHVSRLWDEQQQYLYI